MGTALSQSAAAIDRAVRSLAQVRAMLIGGRDKSHWRRVGLRFLGRGSSAGWGLKMERRREVLTAIMNLCHGVWVGRRFAPCGHSFGHSRRFAAEQFDGNPQIS